MYEFVWAFISHVVDSHGVNADEDKAHNIKVYGSPVVFEDHVRVARQKNYDEYFLRFVGEPYHIYAR